MTRAFRVSYIEGDGIGPEIFASARSILETLGECFKIGFEFVPAPAGDRSRRDFGEAMPKASYSTIRESDICLKAPVGETALETIIYLRQQLNLYANIRPAKNYRFIDSKFRGVDLVIARENTEDLYVSREFEEMEGRKAIALKVVTEEASKRIARVAFEIALSREAARSVEEKRAKEPSVVCVQKSNVLPKSDGLFLRSCDAISKNFPSVRYSSMYVDTAAMNLVRNPDSFDVIVTSNMYGDILSDEASQVVGGLGLAPSGNLGDDFALFEPVHGCAPDIAGKGIANPLSMLFTVKMMLDWLASKKREANSAEASRCLESAISVVTGSGIKTQDIGGNSKTTQVTQAICTEIRKQRGEWVDDGNIGRVKEDVLLKW
ncbi:MAG TPA: isocitrate/isopropylmalate dehydrogenase family protein [Nitrososphaerales archaeon]|nr:isocitrate/isopropylmalate dehydrogenase family protein [Nitrososphaerales archaeon]